MTDAESRALKPGKLVIFNGDESDSGTVTAITHRFVTIRWRDGHKSYTGHGDMKRVDLVKR